MFLSVQELSLRKLGIRETFRPGAIDFGQQLWQAGTLEVAGSAELSEATMEIRVRGHLTVRMEAECDRCLEAAGFPIDTDFDLVYRPMARNFSDEVIVAEDETEVGFYQGAGLDLVDVLREQVLLALPMQRVCRADCKGICPACGQDRNVVACECQPHLVDDRWAGLRDV